MCAGLCPEKPYYVMTPDRILESVQSTVSGVTSGKLVTEADAERFCR
jgi:hypothetical protein